MRQYQRIPATQTPKGQSRSLPTPPRTRSHDVVQNLRGHDRHNELPADSDSTSDEDEKQDDDALGLTAFRRVPGGHTSHTHNLSIQSVAGARHANRGKDVRIVETLRGSKKGEGHQIKRKRSSSDLIREDRSSSLASAEQQRPGGSKTKQRKVAIGPFHTWWQEISSEGYQLRYRK
ncbi:MAG: hypothetical protein Q9160_008934 [Pyrenula sp. 1 TL-2023]